MVSIIGIILGLVLIFIPDPATTIFGVALVFLSLGHDDSAPTQ